MEAIQKMYRNEEDSGENWSPQEQQQEEQWPPLYDELP